MAKTNGRKIRSVDQYLDILTAAGRSPITIRNYRQILKQYAAFLNIPLEQLHTRLDPDDLVRYAASIADKRETGRKSTLITIHRYMAVNGVEFDELEKNVVMIKVNEEREDKPLTAELLQGMMDQATPHGRALLSFLVSTGCRAGETSKILLSDVGRIENGRFIPDISGDVIQVRNDIAKRKKGGLVFLTREAREYLTVWLKDRARFIADADKRTQTLYALKGCKKHERVPRKETGTPISRPANDQRLFACGYSTVDKTFGRLYRAVDGERGATGNKITCHACRAYFRTNAVKGMSIDLAEGILRHSGYLNAAYVRMTPEERYRQFKEGEASLYITRADHRVQSGKLSALEQRNQELTARLEEIEKTRMTVQANEAQLFEQFKKFMAASKGSI